MDRRIFLATALNGVTALTYAEACVSTATPSEAPSTAPAAGSETSGRFTIDVIVVGAGAAGIQAAVSLQRKGLKVLVLEARNRLGGRVFSQPLGDGLYVELGAQILAQQGQKRFEKLLTRFDFQPTPVSEKGNTVFLNAKKRLELPAGDSPLSLLAMLDLFLLQQKIKAELRTLPTPAKADRSELDAVSAAAWLEKSSWSSEARDYLANVVEQATCARLTEISIYEALANLRTLGGLDLLDGADKYFFSEGLQSLFTKLVRDENVSVRLASPVTAIDDSTDGVTVRIGTDLLRAAFVIVTVPPQLYRTITFTPKLPAVSQEVLERFVPGTVAKVIAVYPHAWWRAKGFSGLSFSPDGAFDFIVDSSKANGTPGILVGLVCGLRAAQLLAFGESDRRVVFEQHVARAFGEAPQMLSFHHVDWCQETFSAGGYSSRRRIHDWTRQPQLFEPNGRIHFAGTETADEWRGYIEGALSSGEREADRIARRFR